MLFFASFAILYPFVKYGFDSTDTGYNVSQFWIFNNFPSLINWDLSWFSTFFSSKVNSIFNLSTLLEMRIAWIVLIFFTISIIYKILIIDFSKKTAIVSSLICIPFYAAGSEVMLIEYHNIPTLFSLILVFYFVKSTKERNTINQHFFSILVGFSFSLLVLSRFPAAIMCLVVFATPLIKNDLFKRNLYLLLLSTILGAFLTVLIVNSIIYNFYQITISDVYKEVFNNISLLQLSESGINDRYDKVILIKDFIVRLFKILAGGIIGLFFVLILKNFYENKLIFNVIIFVTILVIPLIVQYKPGIIIGMSTGLPIIAMFYYPRKNFVLKIIFISSVFLLANNFLSALPMIGLMKYGTILFFSYGVAFMVEKNKLLHQKIALAITIYSTITCFFYFRILYPPRDEAIPNLNKKFSRVEFLEGIYSTEKKVNSITELLQQIEAINQDSKSILTYKDLSIFYRLIGTKPYFKNLWIGMSQGMFPKFEYVESKINNDINENSLPDLIIRNKGSLRSNNWKYKNKISFEWDLSENQIGYLDKKFRDIGYYILWQNDFFAILKCCNEK